MGEAEGDAWDQEGMEAPDLMAWLDKLRDDIEQVDKLKVGDLYDMMNVVVRLHHSDELKETDTMSKPGHMPRLEDFIHGCSEINLVRLAIIKKVNPRVMDIKSAATMGRRADNIDRLLGDDLSKMLK